MSKKGYAEKHDWIFHWSLVEKNPVMLSLYWIYSTDKYYRKYHTSKCFCLLENEVDFKVMAEDKDRQNSKLVVSVSYQQVVEFDLNAHGDSQSLI